MSISKGINTFDTAEVYGNGERWVEKKRRIIIKCVYFSERCIARYKQNHPTGDKEDIVIATKFLPLPYKLSYPSSLINALRASLERLQV
jgi:aryl-alcohol dehydrogenase-like predicted oxidoreductase